MEDIVIVESKDYAQVVFDDVENCYIENQPIECAFTINELLKPDSSDAIGIFKIGFQSYKENVCVKQIDIETISEGKGKVTFDGEDLPTDDGEFYQFVYLSQSKQVRGASTPFQFKRTHISDYVEVEEPEAVLIKTKESAINDTINEIKTRCVHLTEANDMYEKLVKENEDLITTLKEEVATIKLRCLRLTLDNEKLNVTLKGKADNLKNLADTITSLTEENNKLQNKFDDLTAENKSLVDSLQHRIEQVAQLKSDLETVKLSKDQLEAILNLKECELLDLKRDKDELSRMADELQRLNEQIVKLEKQVNDRVEELSKIKDDLKRNETIVTEQSETIQSILNERDNLNNLIQKLTREKTELECSQENLSQELSMSKDKLLAAEQCKDMLRSQLLTATRELNESNAKVDEYLGAIKQLVNKEKQLELEKAELMEKLQQIQVDYESRLEQANGSYYALRLAHVHLESRVKTNDQCNQKYEKELKEQKIIIQKLRLENEDLKERINAGALEYSKLLDKFKMLKSRQSSSHDLPAYNNLTSEIMKLRQENLIHLSQPHRNSTPSEDNDIDSAFQDKTPSHATRATTADIENTLLDALLGSSLYNGASWGANHEAPIASNSHLAELQQQLNQLATATAAAAASQPATPTLVPGTQQQQLLIPTTTQPSKVAAVRSITSSQTDMLSGDLANLMGAKNDLIDLKTNLPKVSPASTSELINQLAAESEKEDKDRAALNMLTHRKPEQVESETSESRVCEICNYVFPTDANWSEIDDHYTIHFGPSCPICFLTFRKGIPQEDFEAHVNNHFPN